MTLYHEDVKVLENSSSWFKNQVFATFVKYKMVLPGFVAISHLLCWLTLL